MKTTKELTKKDCILQIHERGMDRLNEINPGEYGADLHHRMYNEDYFIIGTYQAKEFLKAYDAFEAIEKVQEYEKDHFGEVTTDLSNPEKLVNMLAYVIGEELLYGETKHIHGDCWNKPTTEKDLKIIRREFKKAIDTYNFD